MRAANSFGANASDYLVPAEQRARQGVRGTAQPGLYENYIGSIVDWYAATLMRREPCLLVRGRRTRPASSSSTILSEDCDLKGTNLRDFFRQQLRDTLVFGRTYIAVDFPRYARPRAERGRKKTLPGGRERSWWITRRTRSSTGVTTGRASGVGGHSDFLPAAGRR